MAENPSHEPEIFAQNREQLAYLLTEAAEIEHGLMCCYLFAAFSLKRDAADGLNADETKTIASWRSAIISVAVEEMLHLALVSNLLTAIGFAPQLARPNFPVSPGYHPSGVVVSLAPFDAATLDHFIFLERPEGVELSDGAGFEAPQFERATRRDRLVPSPEDYATVGHLYRGIEHAFLELSQQIGEKQLFVGDPAAQVGQEICAIEGLIPVTDLASAVRALETIVEQGEGTKSTSDRSHYNRFLKVREEYRALLASKPNFAPALPVARNPVMRKPPIPNGLVHVEEATAARLLDLGNSIYGLALRVLARAFGQADDSTEARRVLFDAAIDLMTMMSPVAELLARMPAGDANPGVNAGLTFTMARSNMGGQKVGVWPLLVERTRELANGFSKAAKELRLPLESTAARLETTAANLEKASPVRTSWPLAPSAEPVPASPPPSPAPIAAASSDAPAPVIEESRGKLVVLHFEGKRCIHSRHCVLGAPEVFRANVKGPWLNADGASVESLMGIAKDCPSGAITLQRLDGGPNETAPPVNVARIRENGPLAVHADVDLEGHGKMFRATLCRCGASQNKPFCDSSHLKLPFVATGEPPTEPSEALAIRNGPLTIVPAINGPLRVTGNLEICSGTGRTVNRVQRTSLCRCGGSAKKPFCDGTHARIGFRS